MIRRLPWSHGEIAKDKKLRAAVPVDAGMSWPGWEDVSVRVTLVDR
jgi:hypothetical protein